MSTHKEFIRFTFDCPEELHTVIKMKAAALKQTMKDYLIELLIKDSVENPPKYIDEKSFKKELDKLVKDDAELMRLLANK